MYLIFIHQLNILKENFENEIKKEKKRDHPYVDSGREGIVFYKIKVLLGKVCDAQTETEFETTLLLPLSLAIA
jgi:hypothetical protein